MLYKERDPCAIYEWLDINVELNKCQITNFAYLLNLHLNFRFIFNDFFDVPFLISTGSYGKNIK